MGSPHGPLSENISIACIQILSRFYRCPADYTKLFQVSVSGCKMNDRRGVLRGACSLCDCGCYELPNECMRVLRVLADAACEDGQLVE